MPLVDALLPEFDHEMTVTRKLLERVPDDKLAWKPHAKSYSLGQLAQHVATIPMWGSVTLTESEIDVGGGQPPQQAQSRADILSLFDDNVTKTRSALVGKSDGELMVPWALKRDGHVIFSMPKACGLHTSRWRPFSAASLATLKPPCSSPSTTGRRSRGSNSKA